MNSARMENRAILISSVCIGLVCLGSFFGHNWETLGAVMAHRGDDLGYYQFLPGLFIEHDLRGRLALVHRADDLADEVVGQRLGAAARLVGTRLQHWRIFLF